MTDQLVKIFSIDNSLQVAPAEIEDLLLTHPAVADVAVAGIPDQRSGEIPKAFVVKKPNSSVSERDLQTYVKGQSFLSD